ncbi:uncharacterized protein LOC128209156 isoform X1 [Mya arenaria]|uniref:uncharacterized protein LOC128209156 isoform X1 n=1 Tax=Mya arenaria TaxID=6604 RepID=UPI0022E976B6|nr:uncharacterized protein LOC128209156 isoform X1 [Mya arenaria]
MSNIRVAVRVRPLSNKEQEDGSQEIVQVNENVVRIENIKVRGVPEFGDTARARARDFTFDHVYDSVQGNAPCASQAQASNPLGPWAEAGNHLEVFGDRKQVPRSCDCVSCPTQHHRTFQPEVCQAIYDVYEDEMWATPQTEDEWRPVAEGFGDRWNFPHCCGAIDGKHVAIKKPPKSGSLYYNYKGFFSIVMLAVVDSNYKFIWVDVGSPGSCSDADIFNRSRLEPGLREGTIGLPQPDSLPNDDRDTPYNMVGDDAFPLRQYMLKPYPHRHLARDERIFNYRCSRARRVVENAFGILANRFISLLTTLGMRPSTVTKTVMACMTLHNLMRTRYPNIQYADLDREDEQGQFIAGAWRDQAVLEDVQAAGNEPRLTGPGKELRAYLKNYFCSPAGSVPWSSMILVHRFSTMRSAGLTPACSRTGRQALARHTQ